MLGGGGGGGWREAETEMIHRVMAIITHVRGGLSLC